MGDENSILGASKSLNFEKQPRNSHNHLFHGTLCYGLDTTKFRQKFRLKPKIVLVNEFVQVLVNNISSVTGLGNTK